MFLITTADQRFWKTDEPVLFLGEWCKLFAKKELWQDLSYKVLPYHWDDRKKLYEDYQYLQELYERVLQCVATSMNRAHGAEHSLRYWRIIIGPWLYRFIHIFFDRYQSLECALKSGLVSAVMVGQYKPEDWVSFDYNQSSRWNEGDEHNQYLYNWLIERMEGFHDKQIILEDGNVTNTNNSQKHSDQVVKDGFLKQCVSFYEKNFPYRFNKIVLVSSYLSRMDMIKFQLALGQWPVRDSIQVEMPLKDEISWSMRKEFAFLRRDNRFEELLSEILGQQIPIVYLEGYEELKKNALMTYPKSPRLILTSNAFDSDEAFKSWTAYNVDQGSRFIGYQHGGAYGSALLCAIEEHEIKVTDKYYTWGWTSESLINTKPLVTGKLNNFKKRVKYNNVGDVLLVLSVMPRYSQYILSLPVGASQALSYFNDQYDFVRSLEEKVQEKLKVRLYFDDYSWSLQERWQSQFPNVKFDLCNMPIYQSLSLCRLFVGTCNFTTFLEAFVANYPTVLFWNPAHWELREPARGFYEELKKAGILYDTPQQAAKKVNEIWEDPLSWWMQKDVQQAKDVFCRQFANTSDVWIPEWKRELQGQVK